MNQQQEEQIHIYRLRPSFRVETPYSSEQLEEKIRDCLNKENAPFLGRVIPGHALIYYPEEKQHYWSPQLTLSMESMEEGSLLRGLYGPRPAVWTMFMFFYSLIGFAVVVVAMLGLSYLTLNKPAHILWLLPVLILAFISLYLIAYSGQKMGHAQMEQLHRYIEKCCGIRI